MTATKSKAKPATSSLAERDPDLLKRIYEKMVQTRAVEDRMVAMYTVSYTHLTLPTICSV